MHGETGPPIPNTSPMPGETGVRYANPWTGGPTGPTGVEAIPNYITLARDIAYLMHCGQKRPGGEHYFNHLSRVAHSLDPGSPMGHRVVAYLHDILEDTSFPPETLRALFGADIARDVHMLTRRRSETYPQYIVRLIDHGSDRVLQVKLADLADNLGNNPPKTLIFRYTLADRLLRDALKARAAKAREDRPA